MTLTKDQKTALTVAGVAAAIAVLWYLTRQTGIVVPPSSSVNPAPVYDNSVPGYTSFNVQPGSLAGITPPPSQSPVFNINAPGAGRCCETRDGCFTTDPLATGRGPI